MTALHAAGKIKELAKKEIPVVAPHVASRVNALRYNRTPTGTQQAPVGARRACLAMPGRKWPGPAAR